MVIQGDRQIEMQGKGHSKQKAAEPITATNVLSQLCEFKAKTYSSRCNQLTIWIEIGFLKKGSLSERQLACLRDKLEKRGKTVLNSITEHASLSKKKKEKHFRQIGKHLVCG